MNPHGLEPWDPDASQDRHVLLVGECNPYTRSHDEYALWDEPEGAAGHRMRCILGLESPAYRALGRTNLCVGSWSLEAARERAATIVEGDAETVVMLGRKVARAFALDDLEPFETMGYGAGDCGCDGSRHVAGRTFVALPHPSGLCRVWHKPGAVGRARAVLRAAGVRGLPL